MQEDVALMSVAFTGRISKINRAGKDGFCNFYVDTTASCVPRNRNGSAVCRYAAARCKEYLPVSITGEVKDGVVVVSDMKPVWIDKRTSVDFLVHNCSGIGRKTASVAADCAGSNLFSCSREMLTDMLRLKIPEYKAGVIAGTVCSCNDGLRELEQLLIPYGVSYGSILAVHENLGMKAYEKFPEHPYLYGGKAGIPVLTCDRIAYDMEIPGLDRERICAFSLDALHRAASCGHTYLTVSQILKRVRRTSLRSVYRMEIPELCVTDALLDDKLFVCDGDRVMLKRYYEAEKNVAENFRLLNRVTEHYEITESGIDEIEKELSLQYGKDQRNAFHLLDTNGIKVLTGGPGTGKSTVICGLITYYEKIKHDAKIALCAPTGRAAKRLSEVTGRPASTIHKLIDFCPFGNDEISVKDRRNPVDADCIIVDECSMADAELVALLLGAAKCGTLIIFCGDVNQLPSVGAGNVLHDMVRSGIFPVFRLNENFRQANGGSIYENSCRILDGMFPVPAEDFKIYRAKDEQDAYNVLCQLGDKLYDKEHPFDLQFLSSSRKGTAGAGRINMYFHSKNVNPGSENEGFCVDDKVAFTATDYKDGYINGEIGIIRELSGRGITIWNGTETYTVPLSASRDMEYANSITVHRSQGSEGDNIVIYLSEEMKHMMSRNLFYTAVTRAKKNVWVIYTGDALKCAIENVSDIRRQTMLLSLLGVDSHDEG